MKNLICWIFGHKWKKEIAQRREKFAWGAWIEERCVRCGIRNMK